MSTLRSKPKVSILMPNYNCAQYLGDAIESILNQSFSDFEFIINDDNSTDNSVEIIKTYSKIDHRIILIQNEKNLGVQNTRNQLFEKASGEYYALFDSDDISMPKRIEKQVKFLDINIDYVMCGSNFDIINKEGEVEGEKKFPETNKEIRNCFFYRNPFGQNTVMIRSDKLKIVGLYDKRFSVAEDLDLWIRLGEKYKLYNLQEKLVKYRLHGENSMFKKQKLMIKNTLYIRKAAIGKGYKISFKGKIHYLGTWFMQFLPSKFVFWLFNKITG